MNCFINHSKKFSILCLEMSFLIVGNDPIKNHCAIPLDGSANRGKDPRHWKYSPQTSTLLPLPKFIYEHRSTPSSSRRSSIPDPFRSPPQQKHESRCPRNTLPASISGVTGQSYIFFFFCCYEVSCCEI